MKPETDAFELHATTARGHRRLQVRDQCRNRQVELFDRGLNDLDGQQLLFNSDPGDLQNPRTQENRQ